MTKPTRGVEGVVEASPAVLADVLREALTDDTNPEQAAFRLLDESIEMGGDRRGAWPLLGADALITALSANIVATQDDPESGLGALYRRCLAKP